MQIDKKNVIITGGLGCLGGSVASFLKEQGANVFIFDRINSDQDNVFNLDLSDPSQVDSILNKLPNIDILINCAGEIYSEPVVNVMKGIPHSVESWHRIISNNLDSCFVINSRVAAKMCSSRTKGVIINFSSISAAGNMGQVAYSAAKAGVEAMTKVLAKELGMFKIRACAIAPGFIETESTKESLSDSMLLHWKKNTPLRQLGNIDDVLKSIKYIIETDYLSGAIIHIDGGLTL